MKTLRRLCFLVVLATMFAVPALGGEMQGPGAPGQTDTPPAPGDTQGPAFASNGIIHTPGPDEIVLALAGMFF
jgi:hypothetical protein